MVERVQKILSQWGITSRRHAEAMILAGRVRLNGNLVNLGDKANPESDRLEVDGKIIQPQNRPQSLYILVNKPSQVVATCHDPQNRPTVIDLLPQELRQGQGLHPVGRLDYNSTGALLLTNDGELTLSLTHPRYHLPKTYQVWLEGELTEIDLQPWREGLMLLGKRTLPAQVTILKRHRQQTLLQVIITEGRNRQIRRIAEEIGCKVLSLHRIAIGRIQLQLPNQPSLSPGDYRFLTDSELRFLQNHVHLAMKN